VAFGGDYAAGLEVARRVERAETALEGVRGNLAAGLIHAHAYLRRSNLIAGTRIIVSKNSRGSGCQKDLVTLFGQFPPG
jgi:hypothetical protein